MSYGFIVTDKTASVNISLESGLPTKIATGTDPWDVIFRDVPFYLQMANFPWDRVQVLPKDYGKPTN